jgi:hypothetical protein
MAAGNTCGWPCFYKHVESGSATTGGFKWKTSSTPKHAPHEQQRAFCPLRESVARHRTLGGKTYRTQHGAAVVCQGLDTGRSGEKPTAHKCSCGLPGALHRTFAGETYSTQHSAAVVCQGLCTGRSREKPTAHNIVIQSFSSVSVRHFLLLNCLKHFKTLKHSMFIHYMFRTIRPSSSVKIVVRGSCRVLVFLMVVYCNLGSLPAFVNKQYPTNTQHGRTH